MTFVLDATALMDFFSEVRAADEVSAIVEEHDCIVPVVNLAEAADKTARAEDVSVDDLRKFAGSKMAGLIEVVPVGADHAWRAAELRSRHYHARRSPLSLADCFLLAVAEPGDTIVTADRAVARAARTEGIEVAGLPDGAGRRP
ncbi:MAG TPA: PIN domain-containing protein [Solirubrobacteraceae bacterium]|nr:PIN domain-containing protein [Solirubrobacteraceae bacterium]